jgi:hypothetical protein
MNASRPKTAATTLALAMAAAAAAPAAFAQNSDSSQLSSGGLPAGLTSWNPNLMASQMQVIIGNTTEIANNAQSTANNATNLANGAQGTANYGVALASNAQGTANQALSAANSNAGSGVVTGSYSITGLPAGYSGTVYGICTAQNLPMASSVSWQPPPSAQYNPQGACPGNMPWFYQVYSETVYNDHDGPN